MGIKFSDAAEGVFFQLLFYAAGVYDCTHCAFRYCFKNCKRQLPAFHPLQPASGRIWADPPGHIFIAAFSRFHYKLHDPVLKRVPRIRLPINGFQCIHDSLLMLRLHAPKIWEPPILFLFRRYIRHVKYIFQLWTRRCRVDQCDSPCAAVNPAPHAVPYSDGRAGGSVRPLCVDEKLLPERVFAETARTVQEAEPFLSAADNVLFCIFRKAEYRVIFLCHKPLQSDKMPRRSIFQDIFAIEKAAPHAEAALLFTNCFIIIMTDAMHKNTHAAAMQIILCCFALYFIYAEDYFLLCCTL